MTRIILSNSNLRKPPGRGRPTNPLFDFRSMKVGDVWVFPIEQSVRVRNAVRYSRLTNLPQPEYETWTGEHQGTKAIFVRKLCLRNVDGQKVNANFELIPDDPVT